MQAIVIKHKSKVLKNINTWSYAAVSLSKGKPHVKKLLGE